MRFGYKVMKHHCPVNAELVETSSLIIVDEEKVCKVSLFIGVNDNRLGGSQSLVFEEVIAVQSIL